MQVLWIALFPLVHIADGSVFPVPATLRNNIGKPRSQDVIGKEYVKRSAKRKHERSTSSSSGERIGSASADSLGIEDSDVEDSEEKKRLPGEPQGCGRRKRRPTDSSSLGSSDEPAKPRRKWHRRCEPCPRDMIKKWRDSSINWICGGYQRARRSFKSICMMQYRNCQDGTMFVKLSDHRCDDKAAGYNGGRHFFYDYNVELPDDSSDRQTEESSDETYSDSDSSD